MKYFKALEFAKRVHKGQVDKAGRKYILHPLAVSKNVNKYTWLTTEEKKTAKIVALLHDTLEDSKNQTQTEKELRNSFGDYICDTVWILSRQPNESYNNYIRRIGRSKNKIAIVVKKCDLEHNMDLSRLNTVTEKDIKRVEKYRKAFNMLPSERSL